MAKKREKADPLAEFEKAAQAAFTVAFDGKVLSCNAHFGQLVRRPMERIIGHPLHELVAERSHAAASSLLLAAQRQPVRQRLVFQTTDGTAVPAHVSAHVLNQPDGPSICVVASDLTELENSSEVVQQLRRQQEALQAANEELAATEEELRVQNEELNASRSELDRTRARYQDLFETAPDGYLVTDPEGTIQEVNRAAIHLLGRPAAELRGNPFSSLLPAGERENYLQLLASLTAGTTAAPRWEVEIRPLEGPRFWADVTAAASRDEEGHIVGLRWLLRDVSRRKRAEEALRQSEESFRALAENVPDLITRFDRNLRLVYANPAVFRLTGLSKESIIGRTAREYGAPPEAADYWEKAAREVLNLGEPRRIEHASHWQGEARVFDVQMMPERDADGAVWAVVSFAHDITARKQAEEALLKMTEELARSNKDLEQFAYISSHDLQEPLRMISGFLTLLRDKYKGRLDEKADEYIDFSVDGATRMAAMIEDLLEYSRIGGAKRQVGPVNLAAVAEHAKANLGAAIERSSAVIAADPLPTVTGDAGLMKQLFQNLMGNAIKFHAAGRRPEVHIGARQDGGEWVVHVKDNGIGIDPTQADRLFKFFQRLHTREKYPGTGMGLAICRKIVECHGGRIWVESEPGKGSTFCFSLPAGAK